MAVNPTIEAILAKMDDMIEAIGAISNTSIVDAITESNDKLQQLIDISGNTYEKVNTIEFNTANIAEYLNQIRAWTLEEDTHAIRAYLEDIIGPMIEAIMFNGRQANAALRILSCLCDVHSTLPVLPGDNTPPADNNYHCQRAHYYVDELYLRLTEVLRWIDQGVEFGNDTIAYIFGFNVVVGIDDSVVAPDLRLGFAGLLAVGAEVFILAVRDWLTDNKDAIIDIIYSTFGAEGAKNGIDAYIDDSLTGPLDGPVRTALKLLFNQGALNVLFNQSIDWNTSDYEEVSCDSDSGDVSTLESVSVVICTFDDPDPGVHEFTSARMSIHWGGIGGSGFLWLPYVAVKTEDYVDGADFNDVGKWPVYCIEDMHSYRVRYLEGVNNIKIYRDDVEFEDLGTDWYRFPSDEHAWRIINADDLDLFHIEIQTLVGGVWVPIF